MEKAKERKIVFRAGEKVNLRPVEEEDAPLFAKWINDEETTRYILARFPMNIRDEKKWIENISKNKEGEITLGIETKDGVLIGNISLNIGPVKDRRGSLGIIIGELKFRNNGYGTDAIKTILRYAFFDLNLRKITLSVFSENEKAKKCYKKCGFKVEGVLEKQQFTQGKYVDEICMAIFKKDWQNLQTT